MKFRPKWSRKRAINYLQSFTTTIIIIYFLIFFAKLKRFKFPKSGWKIQSKPTIFNFHAPEKLYFFALLVLFPQPAYIMCAWVKLTRIIHSPFPRLVFNFSPLHFQFLQGSLNVHLNNVSNNFFCAGNQVFSIQF